MNQLQVRQYLERIGLTEPLPAGAEGLKAIQLAHLLTVPYENLDILEGREMPLTEAALFDKIVTRHRGGYCFELNGLLGVLLSALGYGVQDYFARFVKDEPTVPMRRHRIIVAETDGERYIMDVGVGIPIPRVPLKLQEGVQGQYEVKKEPFLGWVIYDRGRRLYAFTEEPQLPIDYEAPHFWCRYAPESPFTKGNMLSIRTPEGRITLDGDVLKKHTPEGVEEIPCPAGEAQTKALKEYFGIEL